MKLLHVLFGLLMVIGAANSAIYMVSLVSGCVPDPTASFSSIQPAIDAAANGDIIYICYDDGVIHNQPDTVVVNKLVKIYGNQSGTKVNVTATASFKNIFNIIANNTEVSNLTIMDAVGGGAAGIVTNASYLKIYENKFVKDFYGVYLKGSTASNISDNTAYGGNTGFYLVPNSVIANSTHNVFEDNTAYNNSYGFATSTSHRNLFNRNKANDNAQSGIIFGSASLGNVVSNSTFFNNSFSGIAVSYSSNSSVLSNTVDGNGGRNGIYVISSKQGNYSSNTAFNNRYGFYMVNAQESNISKNTAYDNIYGILLSGGDNSSIEHWPIKPYHPLIFNNWYGIYISQSKRVYISYMNVTSNSHSQYQIMTNSNVTFIESSGSYNTPENALDLNITGNSIVSSLSPYNNMERTIDNEHGSLFLDNAINVSIKILNESNAGIDATKCTGNPCTLVTVNKAIAKITNNSGAATINLGMFYQYPGTEENINMSRYLPTGWLEMGRTVVTPNSLRYDSITNFTYPLFGIIKR